MSIWRKFTSFINKESIYINTIRKWITFKITKEKKTILVIHLYRLLTIIPSGVYNALAQYNTIEGKVKDTGEYWKEVLKEIQQYIINQTEINDIIIIGDYN